MPYILLGSVPSLPLLLPRPQLADPPRHWDERRYLQFLFNLALVGLLLYLVLCFIRTVRADIRRKVDEASFGLSSSRLALALAPFSSSS